ncbi:glycoside hydrolase family 3 C-terminal domain-containing protein [Sphingobium sufflavum]|uniref:beta-glucosidase family protein n=1 Tax=Sphingobium sufflavum TaxID=1129547 RepID=UPI001F44D61F|nr:glycoside hydrolase family 3 N-terminal domain-containing protein [Sphingobium sufflavum]MCE7798267.1 glycoside hydrolase family 3 C-terminal domain-containing protein [Sphingobium sufflavum]
MVTSKRAFTVVIGALYTTGALSSATAGTPASAKRNPWMSRAIVSQQVAAKTDRARETVASRRAKLLIAAMTPEQKLQQLTGSRPEIVPELPNCFGARHARGIPELNIPTFRISNGPVGVGQNDCVSPEIVGATQAGIFGSVMAAAYTHHTSAKATALPSAISVAASFDPSIATTYGDVIAQEMNDLALHVFEAPGLNLARLPILGRNFEYFGEDPYLTGIMATTEIKAIQAKGVIAMPKHYVANEQETNRQTVETSVDRQVMRELYLLPFEMAVKDGKAASVMCAYNNVNGSASCESREILTDILRKDWGFGGYVQPDFFAAKSTVASMKAGMDQEMPQPGHWAPAKLNDALAKGDLTVADFDQALERRFTQMFKAGIFDRPLVQKPMDIQGHGRKARDIGARSAVLLQNNGALPLRTDLNSIVVIGKATQVYAQQAVAGGALTGKPMGSGGGSSDVVPHYSVTPIEGIRNALKAQGNAKAIVKLILVDDANRAATIDGVSTSFDAALAEAAGADNVVVMAGTISEEGADRATFTVPNGKVLSGRPTDGHGLDWYADRSDVIAVLDPGKNPRAAIARNSQTLSMIKTLLGTRSTTGTDMSRKTVLVLKDNASVAMDPALVGAQGPAILEAWFPGQEDGNIVADLLFGLRNPGGKLPVTFPYAGKGFLDSVTTKQFPGTVGSDGKTQTVEYTEKLAIGYRWYDANLSGQCAPVAGRNPCVAFPFGHGLSYSSFAVSKPALAFDRARKVWRATASVTNTGKRAGAEVVQAYLALPASAPGAPQPPKRLVGFQRIELAPGASGTITITIDPAASNHPLSVWDATAKAWAIPAGDYRVWLGSSSSPADLASAGTFAR